MKSVGEVMGIGRTFCESLQKAARSLEIGRDGLVSLAERVDYTLLAPETEVRVRSLQEWGESPPRARASGCIVASCN